MRVSAAGWQGQAGSLEGEVYQSRLTISWAGAAGSSVEGR